MPSVEDEGAQDEREENAELQDELVIGAEVPDRPVLQHRGDLLDRRTTDSDHRARCESHRSWHPLSHGQRGGPGQQPRQGCERTGGSSAQKLHHDSCSEPVTSRIKDSPQRVMEYGELTGNGDCHPLPARERRLPRPAKDSGASHARTSRA
ncbi:hypothetical protein [Streptomyces violascens]|uniref:hypothetical protein n=1 Tax=Streptomyces violascens TaxID=67381 RepID=UPI00369E6952